MEKFYSDYPKVSVEVNSPSAIAIDFIQSLEKELDEFMRQWGYARETSTKGDIVSFQYRRFGVCL